MVGTFLNYRVLEDLGSFQQHGDGLKICCVCAGRPDFFGLSRAACCPVQTSIRAPKAHKTIKILP